MGTNTKVTLKIKNSTPIRLVNKNFKTWKVNSENNNEQNFKKSDHEFTPNEII